MGIIKNGLALYGMNEWMKKRKDRNAAKNRNPYQDEMKRQDQYDYDRYVYGEDDAF